MYSPSNSNQFPYGRGILAKAVLLDTGAILALANSKDTNHQFASECLKTVADKRLPLFISIPTIYEAHRRILFDLGFDASRQFLSSIFDGTINIERTIKNDELEAKSLTEKYHYLKLTLTDAANMAVMLRLGIATVFSFDRHFIQVGFIRIPQ